MIMFDDGVAAVSLLHSGVIITNFRLNWIELEYCHCLK